MVRYYFQAVVNGDVQDNELVELADLDHARRMAQTYLGDMLRDTSTSAFTVDIGVRVTSVEGLTLLDLSVIGTEAPAIARGN